MSPESITKNQYSTKSDVWSFGVTIVEIWTQNRPYPELTLLQVVSSKNKPKIIVLRISWNCKILFFNAKIIVFTFKTKYFLIIIILDQFCCEGNFETDNFKRRRSIFE